MHLFYFYNTCESAVYAKVNDVLSRCKITVSKAHMSAVATDSTAVWHSANRLHLFLSSDSSIDDITITFTS